MVGGRRARCGDLCGEPGLQSAGRRPARRAGPEGGQMTNLTTDSASPLLVVDDLRVSFPRRDGGMTEAVRGVSFTLGRERLGIVGESGSGKSQTGRAIMGLTAPEGLIRANRLEFAGVDLLKCPPA